MSVAVVDYAQRLGELLQPVTSLKPSILVSATYDGDSRKAVLKFYEPSQQRIHLWVDNTGHQPYCYSKESPENLEQVKSHPDFVEFTKQIKKDLITDTDLEVTKITVTNPLAIGGSSFDKSIRSMIDAWEADIKYYENYIYDEGFLTGALYRIQDNKIQAEPVEMPDNVKLALKRILDEAQPEFKQHLLDWAQLLSQPLPQIKRAAIDIEVLSEDVNRIPDPKRAQQPVIAAAIVGSDGRRTVLVLERDDVKGDLNKIENVSITRLQDEKELLSNLFNIMVEYPFIVTFNGDDFDLHYLYNRAEKLGLSKSELPISMGNNVAYIKHGVHLDLYKTFVNRSFQVYAFSGKYSDHTLNGVCEGLLDRSKMEFEGDIGSLPLGKLAEYCYTDADLTYELTSFNNDLLVKLLLVISRVARMPVDDVARIGVSNWIRSMMYAEHRRQRALIPRREDLESKGGAESSAVIKGKKYKGGLVIDPRPGVHFNVAVLDFASLYPSIIKVHNLSYETVRCTHEACRKNRPSDASDHWVCTTRRGMTSQLIGSLRDLRVNYYKPLSKSKTLPDHERELYGVVSQALKVILNAAYGVMGAEIFPLYCLPVADLTATLGRSAIMRTVEKCRGLGIDVVYGDTDSLFLKSATGEQIQSVIAWAERDLGIELDLDKRYRYVAFSQRKKNYLGVIEDGSVDVKGLTGKKSHTPPFIRDAFYTTVKILGEVRNPEDFEAAREKIKKHIRSTYLALRNHQLSPEQLAFNVMLGKELSSYRDTTPPHVKAAQQLKREVKTGDIISYVITVGGKGVKPMEKATAAEIDVEKYEGHLRSTFDQLMDSLGYTFDETILGETKLEDFFWKR